MSEQYTDPKMHDAKIKVINLMFGPASSVTQDLELRNLLVRLCRIETRKHICILVSSSVQCTTEIESLHCTRKYGEVPRIPAPGISSYYLLLRRQYEWRKQETHHQDLV